VQDRDQAPFGKGQELRGFLFLSVVLAPVLAGIVATRILCMSGHPNPQALPRIISPSSDACRTRSQIAFAGTSDSSENNSTSSSIFFSAAAMTLTSP